MSRLAVDATRPAPGDAEDLAACLRDQDQAELNAGGHHDHARVIQQSIDRSTLCWTVRVGGEMAAVFGVAPLGTALDPRGVPWMLGTDLVPRHRRILARLAPGYIQQMLKAYPHLLNQVHANNSVATRWLRKMGFVLQPPTPIPPYGELFHLFEMRRHV